MAPVCGRAASIEFQENVSAWPFQMANMGLIHLNAVGVSSGKLWRKGLSIQPSCVSAMSSPLEMMLAPSTHCKRTGQEKATCQGFFPFWSRLLHKLWPDSVAHKHDSLFEGSKVWMKV